MAVLEGRAWIAVGLLNDVAPVVTALTIAFSYFVGCNPVLEQPNTSVMVLADPLATVLSAIGATKWFVWHGAYSGESAKGLQLWSTADLSVLQRCRPHNLNVVTTRGTRIHPDTGAIVNTWTGKKKEMKDSQTYCSSFGKAVAELLISWIGTV